MTHAEIMEKFTEIFRDQFEDDAIELSDGTSAKDIEDWDSLAYLQLVSTIESAFRIKFTLGEINGFKNVGEMADSVEKHLEQKNRKCK